MTMAENKPVSISLAAFPQNQAFEDPGDSFTVFQQIVTAARELRADNKLDPKATLDASLYLHGRSFTAEDLKIIAAIPKLNLQLREGAPTGQTGLIRSQPGFDLQIHAAPATTQNGAGGAEARARLERENADLQRAIDTHQRQLSNPVFLGKAPEHVINGMRGKLADYETQLAKNRKLLEALP